MPPMVLRDGAPTELEPLADGGTIAFPEPVGERGSLDHTLHSEVLTLPVTLGARDVRLPPLAGARRCSRRAARARRPPAEEIAAAAPRAPSAQTWSAQHVEVDRARRTARPRRRRRHRAHRPARGMGPGRRDRLDRAVRRGGRAPVRAREAPVRRRAAARALLDPEAAVRRARDARLHGFELTPPRPSEVAAMKVGVPTEIKTDEYRVALTPAGVRELVDAGHEVFVQKGAGEGSAIRRRATTSPRARTSCPTPTRVFDEAELIVKVKEPQPAEVARLRPAPHALHLPAPRARPRADHGAARLRRDVHRLRDRRGRPRAAAAAGPDERGRGEDRHAGRRVHAREAARRPRDPARRRARRGGGERDGHRRRRRRDERGVHRRSGWRPTVFVFDRSIDRLRELDVAFGGRCSTPASPRRWTSSSACPRPTSSSARCSSTAPRRRTSSRARSWG